MRIEYNDNELLYLISEYDEAAFEILCEKYRPLIINRLKNIKNLTITYKLQDYKSSFYPSTLCSHFEVVKNNKEYP